MTTIRTFAIVTAFLTLTFDRAEAQSANTVSAVGFGFGPGSASGPTVGPWVGPS